MKKKEENEEKMKMGWWKKRLITWSWWGEGGERREEISLTQREVIGQIAASIETLEECVNVRTQNRDTNVTAPIASTTLYFCFSLSVCVFGL